MEVNKFYFINKSPASKCLTQSRGVQWSEIQSHVQKGLSRPRKSKIRPNKEVAIVDDNALYNPTVRSLGCRCDPFNTASIEIDSTVRGLLHYYIYYYHPTTWTYDPARLNTKPYAFKNSVIKTVDNALEDDLAMYCLLSASAARIRHVDFLPFQLSNVKEHEYTQQALYLMKQRITRGTVLTTAALELVVSCIMFLGSAESYRDDYTSAKTHFEAVLKLLQSSGGVMQLQNKDLQGHLLMGDLFLSAVNLQPCICGTDYDPGPASVLALSTKELLSTHDPNLGISFLGRACTIMPPELRSLVLEILESHSVKRRLNTQVMSAGRFFETTYWVTKRNMAIRNRLLALKLFDVRVHALRTCVIMWTLLSMNITGRIKTVKIMATKLRSILDDILSYKWSGVEDIRFWILTVGLHCADNHSQTYIWFAEQLRNLYSQKSATILTHSEPDGLLEALEKFQQGFLFHPSIQRSRTDELAGLLTLQNLQ